MVEQQLSSCVDYVVETAKTGNVMGIVPMVAFVGSYVWFALTKSNIADMIKKATGKILSDSEKK